MDFLDTRRISAKKDTPWKTENQHFKGNTKLAFQNREVLEKSPEHAQHSIIHFYFLFVPVFPYIA